MKNQTIRTLLGATVSALAITAACGMVRPADAQTLALPSGFNTVTIGPNSGNTGTVVGVNGGAATSYSTIEIGNGITGWLVPTWAAQTWAVGQNTALVMSPTNISTLPKCLNSGLAYSTTSCLNHGPALQVDQGGTLRLGGQQTNSGLVQGWGFESVIHADGAVIFDYEGPQQSWGNPTDQLVGANYFGGDVVLMDMAHPTLGLSWASATTQFGTNTNIILNGTSQLTLYQSPAAPLVMGGSLQGTGTLVLGAGTLVINGKNTAAVPFAGNLNILPGTTAVIGDASHASAVIGNPGNLPGYTLTLAGTTSGGSTLRGFGTIAGNLVNTSSTVQPGYGGSLGTLTVQGNYSQNAIGTIKVQVSPAGASALHVVGNATMNGTLNIIIEPGSYKTQIYNVVQVDGTMTGDFSSLVTDSSVQGAIAAVTKSAHGYQVVTELLQGADATAPIVAGHLADVNRLDNYFLVGALYDRVAQDTPRGSTEIGRNKYAWIEGFGQLSSVARNDVGYHTDTEGVRGGVEYRTESNATIGLAASYSNGSLRAKGASTADMSTWHIAAYGGSDVQYARLDGVLFYDATSTTMKRDFGTDGMATASPDLYSYGASIQVSRSLMRDLLTPYVRGIYSRQHVDASTETGAPLLNLHYLAINHNTFVADLGVHINPLRDYPEGKTKLLITVALEHDFSPLGERVEGTFPVGSTQSWFSYWRGDSENTGILGIDVARQITDKLEVSGRLNGRMSLYQTSGELALNARYRF